MTDVDLVRVAASTERLLANLVGLDDAAVASPSLLPGWTRGHVLTHIARNADSHRRRIEGSLRGDLVDQYVGGYEGRAADIEAGAARSVATLIDDVAELASALHTAWSALPDEVWDRPSRDVSGTVRPARDLPARRCQEVEIHHVDLDLGYGPHDWPADFVDEALTRLAPTLEHRLPPDVGVMLVATDRDSWPSVLGNGTPVELAAPAAQLLAWVVGRPCTIAGAPPLLAW